MKNLQLSLIGKWFELTRAGIKLEDYREITPYWCGRLLLYNGEPKKQNWWSAAYNSGGFLSINHLRSDFLAGKITYKDFDQNTMTLGYPNKNDSARIIKIDNHGTHIGTGIPEWGAIPGKMYFVIKHVEGIK